STPGSLIPAVEPHLTPTRRVTMPRSAWFGTALLGLAMLTPSVKADLPPLIPRDVLFGNPDRAGPQISPDGKRIAYLRPDDHNALQGWVRSTVPPPGEPDDHPVTQDPKRGIRQYYWAHDNKHLLYLQDTNGDENYHLYAVNLDEKKTRDLTPFEGVRVAGVD